MSEPTPIAPAAEAPRTEQWRVILVEGHTQLVRARWLFKRLPGSPRCKMCNNPFGGFGGRVLGLAGWRPSRKNPNFCERCCDAAPVGGADVDVAVLFADVRGSTGLGETAGPAAFAGLLNRFYATATDALLRHDAVIDKLIGDEVMAFFVPGISGPEYRRRAVDAGIDLLRSVGYGTPEGPWIDVGAAVHAGVAYVGNVGGAIVDFTALGDPVNVAARLQGHAAAGELLVSDAVADQRVATGEHRTLTLRGRAEPVSAYVVSA